MGKGNYRLSELGFDFDNYIRVDNDYLLTENRNESIN